MSSTQTGSVTEKDRKRLDKWVVIIYDKSVIEAKGISAMLRRQRKKLGLSLSQVARIAGTSVATLSRYENGWTRFEINTLRRLSSALGCRLRVELDPLPQKSKSGNLRGLGRLFWDSPFEVSDIERFPKWVVARVVQYGALEDVHALADHLGVDRFLQYVASVRFSSRKASVFWQRILTMQGIPCTRKRSHPEAELSYLP